MNAFEHGGDWAAYEYMYKKKPLDFSANVCPLGIPDGVRRVLSELSDEVMEYPDPYCRKLRTKISETEKIPMSQIVCGNGVTDLIYRIAYYLRPKKALLLAPGFSEYEKALLETGCRIERYYLKEQNGFLPDDTILSSITEKIDVFFMCEPNNPTGLIMDDFLLDRIAERCAMTGTILVIDESFGDFLKHEKNHSMRRHLQEYPNLVILKAFTKIYALAGLRVGYAVCSDRELLEGILHTGQPWPVCGPAQAAATAALDDRGYKLQAQTIIEFERINISRTLQHENLKVVPGKANFLLFEAPRGLDAEMAKRGVLIRNCANFPGLKEGWYRIAIRTNSENLKMIETMRECLEVLKADKGT